MDQQPDTPPGNLSREVRARWSRVRELLRRSPITLPQAELLLRTADAVPLPPAMVESIAAIVLSRRIREARLDALASWPLQACLSDTWCLPAGYAVCTHLAGEPASSGCELRAVGNRLPALSADGLQADGLEPVGGPLLRDREPGRGRSGDPAISCWHVFFDGTGWPVETLLATLRAEAAGDDEDPAWSVFRTDSGFC